MKESIKVFFLENKNKSDNKYRLIRKGQKGSLTLEAAVTVPLFMLFCMALISFLLIIGIQMDIQTSMEETARSMGKKAYVLERFAEGEDVSEVDSDTVFLVSAGINPTVIKVWLLATDSLGEKIESSRIIGGAGGLYT